MFTGYLSFGGTEIGNAERFAVYARAARVFVPRSSCRAPGLPALLGDTPYSTPAADAAPWHDVAVPASAEFIGVLPLEVTGVNAATGSREVTGGLPGPQTYTARTVAVTALLAATSPAGLSYGLSWLANALKAPSTCEPRCDGDTVTMLAAAPPPVPGVGEWARLARQMFTAALAAGPSVVEQLPAVPARSCSPLTGTQPCAVRVEFTIVAADPFIHTLPVPLGAAVTFTDPPDEDCAVTWLTGCTPADLPDCGPAGACGADPLCPSPEPPVMPEPPPSPCGCTKQLAAATAAIAVAPGTLPVWAAAEPVVTVMPGAEDMRRLTVLFYAGTCADPADVCDVIAELNVPFIPAGTTLIADTRSERATLVCADGRTLDAQQLVAGPDSTAYTWPVLPCPGPLCVRLRVESQFYAAAASVLVEVSARSDAG